MFLEIFFYYSIFKLHPCAACQHLEQDSRLTEARDFWSHFDEWLVTWLPGWVKVGLHWEMRPGSQPVNVSHCCGAVYSDFRFATLLTIDLCYGMMAIASLAIARWERKRKKAGARAWLDG